MKTKTINLKNTFIVNFLHLILTLILSVNLSYAACSEDVVMNGFKVTNLGLPKETSDAVPLSYVATINPSVNNYDTTIKPYFWLSDSFPSTSPYNGYGSNCNSLVATKAYSSIDAGYIYGFSSAPTVTNIAMLNISNGADCMSTQTLQSASNHSMLSIADTVGTGRIAFPIASLKDKKAFSISVLLKSNTTIPNPDRFWLSLGSAEATNHNTTSVCSLSYDSTDFSLFCNGTQLSSVASNTLFLGGIAATVTIPFHGCGSLDSSNNPTSDLNMQYIPYGGNPCPSAAPYISSVKKAGKVEMQFFKKDATNYHIAVYFQNRYVMSATANLAFDFTFVTLGATKSSDYKIAASGLYGIPIIY